MIDWKTDRMKDRLVDRQIEWKTDTLIMIDRFYYAFWLVGVGRYCNILKEYLFIGITGDKGAGTHKSREKQDSRSLSPQTSKP